MSSSVPITRPITITVSGSFRRHLPAIQDAVETARTYGATVLSPADPRIVDSFGDFVFVSSDRRRSIKGVQNRHLEAIRASDLLWLVCPDGYVGPSASLEVGFAVGTGIPIYTDVPPMDWTLRQYVQPVGTIGAALLAVAAPPAPAGELPSVLVDPRAGIEAVRADLEIVENTLLRDTTPRHGEPLEAPLGRIRRILSVP